MNINTKTYDARCRIIDLFGENIASMVSAKYARTQLTKVLLIWQRWASEDMYNRDPNVTFDWTGPLDLLPSQCNSTVLEWHQWAWEAASLLTDIDILNLKEGT